MTAEAGFQPRVMTVFLKDMPGVKGFLAKKKNLAA
jgi:hypothetical protein